MKTKLGIMTGCLLLVCLFAVAKEKSTSIASGQSLTALGDYSINTTSEPITIGGEALVTYELKYSNSDTPVKIGLKKTKKCMNFIVRTANFEVEYICKNHVFGVKRINKEYQSVSQNKLDVMIDNANFYSQRIISQYPKTEEEILGLIACYFPSLIKDQYLSSI